MDKKKYAIVGCGARHSMYMKAVIDKFPKYCKLVALCDNNEGRMHLSVKRHLAGDSELPLYGEMEFDSMIGDTRPDFVIVTTKDSFHDKYIIRAMELGCGVMTEKPMTIDAEKCGSILKAIDRTGKELRVTFNYRYSPPRTQVKELLMSGVIGRIVSVDFHWLLDIRHGADYFRRWHRNKENSGGLMVHKATHHFDLVNWWLSSTPDTVYARGSREFYTPETARRYGLNDRGERCLDCPEKGKCRFCIDIESEGLKNLYRDCESYDEYYRDRCVFSDKIDIEDTMNLVICYKNGAYMSYSLNAYCPKEGYSITFNGTRGRLEHTTLETSYVSGSAKSKVHETIKKGSSTWIFPHFSEPYQVELWTSAGGHGGGDDPMLQDLFHPQPPEDKYKRAAGVADGAWSILTGVAANKSLATGRAVSVPGLVDALPDPEYTDMPEW
jgi:predicted dehydrogenase